MAPGRLPVHGPAGAGQNQAAADNSPDLVTTRSDLLRGISPRRCARKGPPTCNSYLQVHRAAKAPLCQQSTRSSAPSAAPAAACKSAAFSRLQSFLFSLTDYSSPSGRSVGASNFHSRIFVDGYSLQCPRQLDTFNFKELKFDAALLVERPDTPRECSPSAVSSAAPSVTPRSAALASPLFPTRLSAISCGPRFGVAPPSGRGLVRLLRA